MGIKIVIWTIACFAFLLQPAYSADIVYVRAEPDPVQEISSLVPKLIAAKTNAVMKAAADVASVVATGMGHGVRTLGQASSDIKGAISDGLLAMGDSILRAGDTATGASSRNARVLFRRPMVQEVLKEVRRPMVEEVNVMRPSIVKEEYVMPYDEEVVEVPMEPMPIRSIKRNRPAMTFVEPARRVNLVRNEAPSLWNLLGNAVHAKMNAARMLLHGPPRSPVVYEVINEPRLLPRRLEDNFEFEFKKK